MSEYSQRASSGSGNSEIITLNKDKPVQHSAKDPASLGSEALAAGNFPLAISHYTNALRTHPQAVDYYIKRSTAYTRILPSDHSKSLSDAEIAVVLAHKRGKREFISQAQLRRGIALFGLGRYADASQCFTWVKKLNEKEKTLSIWEAKVQSKLAGLENEDSGADITVKEIPDVDIENLGIEPKKTDVSPINGSNTTTSTSSSNDINTATPVQQTKGVQTPANKIRHEWYQSADSVTITLLAKGVPKDKATVDIQSHSLAISFPLSTGSEFDLSLEPLYGKIDHTASTYKIMSTKVEFILKKATPGQKWHSLESTEPITSTSDNPTSTTTADDAITRTVLSSPPTSSAPSYPTSSRTGPKNWDKLAADLTKKPAASSESKDASEETWVDDDDDGGDPAQAFFKKIFKSADPDTQRAMKKSYMESNGTALSTNWAEVGKGKVETSPPDGMVAKKWGE